MQLTATNPVVAGAAQKSVSSLPSLGGRIPELDCLRGVAATLSAFALTIALAALSWCFFEKPLIRRGHSYSYWEEQTA
jgi:peptidoglycan/LPS O-acetylase OafA/YrhL